MARMIFVNLPVKDLKKSIDFFSVQTHPAGDFGHSVLGQPSDLALSPSGLSSMDRCSTA